MKKIFLFLIFCCQVVNAQSTAEESEVASSHLEFSATAGTLLPNNISGITEILSGAEFGLSTGISYCRLEGKYLFINSEGILLKRYSISITDDFTMFEMKYFWAFGFNGIEYMRNTAFNSDKALLRGGGWHYGAGIKTDINKLVYLRTEFNLAFRPGKTLFVGMGIGFRLFTGDSAK